MTSIILDELLNSSDIIELENIAITSCGLDLSNNTTLSSSTQLVASDDNEFMIEFGNVISNNGFEYPVPNTNSPFNGLGASPTELGLNEHQNEKLQITAQPKAVYRPRYSSEMNQAYRFIRTENTDDKYEYPTIKIPSWCQPNQQLYIRVTLVTVSSDRVPYHCIHPYAIDTPDQNAIKDEPNNSLLFRINENEFNTREKSFRIIILKKKQDELKSCPPMHLFDLEPYENVSVENPEDPKQKKFFYQLSKAQFVFTIVQRQDNKPDLVLLGHTSVKSQIMIEEKVAKTNSPTDHLNGTSNNIIRCIPQKGRWEGGDEIVINMPNPIKGKDYTIYFDFGQNRLQFINGIIPIDTNTILIQTPSCPIPSGDENLKVLIIIKDNKSIIYRIEFYYIPPMKTTDNIHSYCQRNGMNNPISNKRRWEYDSVEYCISQMNQLSIEQKTNESHSQISSNENNSKAEKYLNQLKDALEIFVRKNDPSRLFRRTRVLLSKYDKDPSPLNDAIQHGHTKLALSLIEQIIDMPSPNRLLENENENGETPLLIAAKLNEWEIIESILKSRSNLAKQKDKDGNNLLHSLANLSEDKGAETIKNVLAILPNELKMDLLKEKKNSNEKPMDIAKSHNNTSSLELLIDIENNSE